MSSNSSTACTASIHHSIRMETSERRKHTNQIVHEFYKLLVWIIQPHSGSSFIQSLNMKQIWSSNQHSPFHKMLRTTTFIKKWEVSVSRSICGTKRSQNVWILREGCSQSKRACLLRIKTMLQYTMLQPCGNCVPDLAQKAIDKINDWWK